MVTGSRSWALVLLCVACTPEGVPDRSRGGDDVTETVPATSPPDVVDTSTTPSDTATDVPAVVGYPYPEYDCTLGVPEPPFDMAILHGTVSNEDLALDLDGYVLAPDFNGNVRRATYDGIVSVMGTGFGDPTGLEVLPSRDVVVADRNARRIVRWDHTTGGLDVIATNVGFPNGIEVAPDGSVFVTDSYPGSVFRVDPATGAVDVVAPDIFGADGLTFDPTYHTLYVGSMSTGDITTVPVYGPGSYGEAQVLVSGADAPWKTFIDGIAVDRCGNVYVADFVSSVWRVDPATLEIELVWEDPADYYIIPAMRFGSGVGGWDAMKLYVSTYNEVVEIDVGVPGKARWPTDWP